MKIVLVYSLSLPICLKFLILHYVTFADNYDKALTRLKQLENESNVSAYSSDENDCRKRHIKCNPRYFNMLDESENSKKNLYRKTSLNRKKHSSSSDTDGEVLPEVPEVKNSLKNKKADKDEHTETVKTPEPVLTFNTMAKAINRLEGRHTDIIKTSILILQY